MNIGSQIIIIVVVTAAGFIVPLPTMSKAVLDPAISKDGTMSIIVVLATVIWLTVFSILTYQRLGARPGKHTSDGFPYLCGPNGVITHLKNAPRPMKSYLLYHVFAAMGLNSVVAQSSTYFAVQLKLSGIEVGITILCTLVVATSISLLYAPISKKIQPKYILMGTHMLSITGAIIAPLTINREGQFVPAVALSGIVGICIGFYYAAELASFSYFVPAGDEGMAMGLYGFTGLLLRWLPSLVYGTITQVMGDQKFAFMSMALYMIIALVLLFFVDFAAAEQITALAKKDRAEAANKSNGDKASESGSQIKVEVTKITQVEPVDGDKASSGSQITQVEPLQKEPESV